MRILMIFLVFIFTTTGTVTGTEPVKIGLTLGLSGKYARMADMNQKGLILWAEKINKGNGLLGKKVELIIYDDKSDKGTAKALYEKLILQDKVDLLFGPYSSGLTGAVLPVTEKHGYPLLLIGAAADSLWSKGYKYAFGIFTPASRYTVGFLEMAAMQGIQDVAIVFADDSFSTTIAMGARQWGEQFGLNIKFFQSFKKGTRDLTDLAVKAKASKAPALVVCGHLNESVDMRKAIEKISWIPAAYFATVGPAMDVYQEQLGKNAELAFSSSQWEPAVMYKPEDHKIFLEPFMNKYNKQPSYHAAQAFAAGQILETAVGKVKSLDREKLRQTFSRMDTTSIIGRYKVDKTGKQIRHFQLALQIQKGKKEIVWPESLATSKPVFQ